MPDNSLRLLISLTAAFFLGITCFIIYFIVLYRNKQLKNQQEQEQQQSAFRQELLKAQIEMQEQTLQYISREIHDNVTQVLSFVKLSLALAADGSAPVKQTKINESRELVAQAITDLRDLSKSLSFEHITRIGLLKTIEIETGRINKSGIIKVHLLPEGEVYPLGEQRELVLYRIMQEALNNTLKHAGAKHFKISLQYQPELFNLTLEDDGNGFPANLPDKNNGSGLKNMESRATLIGAVATIDSSPGNGCRIKVTLNPLEQRLYTDGYHPDRISR
jgi:signal transduction histidine kinase